MKELEEKIKEYGIVLPGNVLKVDAFLNHELISPSINVAYGSRICQTFLLTLSFFCTPLHYLS